MSVIQRVVPWTVQPQGPIGLNTANPLTRGLCAVFVPSMGLRNVVNGTFATKSGSIDTVTGGGRSWIMSATTDIVSSVVPALESTSKDLTFFWMGPTNLSAGPTASRIFHYGSSLFGAGMFVTGTTSNALSVTIGNGTAVAGTGAVTNYLDSVSKSRYGVTWNEAAGKAGAYKNGAFVEDITVAANRSAATGGENLWLLNRDTANRPIGVGNGFSIFLAWNRALTAQEHAMIGANPWQIFQPLPSTLFAPAAAGGAYTLTADAGSYSLSGQDAALVKSRIVVADAGSYALAGQDAALLKSKLVTGDAGSYALAGQDATLVRNRVVTADPGAYTIAGQDATLTYTPVGSTYTLTCDAGSYALAGQDAALIRGRVVTADAGAYSISGQDATLTYSGATQAAGGSAREKQRRKVLKDIKRLNELVLMEEEPKFDVAMISPQAKRQVEDESDDEEALMLLLA